MAVIRFEPNRWPWEFEVIVLGISVLFSIPLVFGIFSLCLGLVRGEKIKFSRLLDAFRNYPSVILVSVTYYLVLFGVYIFIGWLMEEIIGLGIILLIVWFIVSIILMCKLVFVPFLITDRKMKGFGSIRASWSMTRGHAGTAFGIGLLLALVGVGVWIISLLLNLAFGPETVAGQYTTLAIILLLEILLYMWFVSAFTSLCHSVSVHDKNDELKDENDGTYQLA